MSRQSCKLWTSHAGLSLVVLTLACTPASSGNASAEPPTTQTAAPEKPAATSQHAPDATTAPTAPATLKEAARAVDPRSLPMLKHGEVFYKNIAKVGYQLAEPDLKSDVRFYKDKLTQTGWKVESEEVEEAKSFGCVKYTKDGFCVAVDVVKNPNDGKMMAFVENYGNVDARSLPRYAGAKEKNSGFNVFNHDVNAKADDVAAFVRTEFKKLGWRPTIPYGTGSGSVEEKYYFLGFIQNGINVNVHVTADKGVSEVMYHASLLRYAAPIHPEATGSIELGEDPNLRMFYSTKASAKDVLAFYRRELPAIGWSIKPGPDEFKDGQTTVAVEGPAKEPLRLEVLEKGKISDVQIVPADAKVRSPE